MVRSQATNDYHSHGCPLQVEDAHFLGDQCYTTNVIVLMILG